MFGSGDNYDLKMGPTASPLIMGLDDFRDALEREYFCEVNIRNYGESAYRYDLVISMRSSLNLGSLVRGHRDGIWGHLAEEQEANPLLISLEQLNLQNPVEVDIEEIAIFLQDTLLVIKNIYPRSVAEQFGHLMEALSEHYDCLKSKGPELPYEIYIPVFEEGETDPELPIQRPASLQRCSKDYLGYWGLYYDTDEDAVIYDLRRKETVSGDLYMLDQ